MARQVAELVVRIADQASAPARAISSSIGRMVDSINRDIARLNRQMADVRGQFAEAAAAGYGLARSLAPAVKAATDMEAALVDLGLTANASSAEIKGVGDEARQLAPKVNQFAGSIVSAQAYLVGMGLELGKSRAAMPAIGKAATATGTDILDMAKSGFAAMDNLKVAPEQLADAFERMAKAGQEGGFELKSMAQFFPSLTAVAQNLGVRGVKGVTDLAAALQIARKGAGSPGEAATNLQNLLMKMTAPEAVNKFAEVGINIRRKIAEAVARGDSPIEEAVRQTYAATRGNMAKIGSQKDDIEQLDRSLRENSSAQEKLTDRTTKLTEVVDRLIREASFDGQGGFGGGIVRASLGGGDASAYGPEGGGSGFYGVGRWAIPRAGGEPGAAAGGPPAPPLRQRYPLTGGSGADTPRGPGVSSRGDGGAARRADMMRHAMDQLRREGVPEQNVRAAAAHLVGQATMESGLDPNKVHGQGTGYGIYGARDPSPGRGRRTDMLRWLEAHGYPRNSAEGQTRYMAHEAMTGRYRRTRDILMSADPQRFEADTNTITREFESPKIVNRRQDAVSSAFRTGPSASPDAPAARPSSDFGSREGQRPGPGQGIIQPVYQPRGSGQEVASRPGGGVNVGSLKVNVSVPPRLDADGIANHVGGRLGESVQAALRAAYADV